MTGSEDIGTMPYTYKQWADELVALQKWVNDIDAFYGILLWDTLNNAFKWRIAHPNGAWKTKQEVLDSLQPEWYVIGELYPGDGYP